MMYTDKWDQSPEGEEFISIFHILSPSISQLFSLFIWVDKVMCELGPD